MPMSYEALREFVDTQTSFLNMRYFDGALSFEVRVHNRESHRWYAKCCHPLSNANGVACLLLNPVLVHASIGELELIIAHELVHVAQCVLGMKMCHGKPFRDLARKFNIPVESSNACAGPKVRPPSQMKRGAPAIV